jgi:steroid 5-alpha reductase family enzyme
MIAWWLLLGGGLETAHRWVVWIDGPGDTVRGVCLATAFSIYYVRILFTESVFLKRGVGWGETFTIAPWLLFIFPFLGIENGRNPSGWGIMDSVGAVLFLIESWMNTFAEYGRHIWKQRAENRGKLYTFGLFRCSRHPNYLGDLLLFSGLCLISGELATAVIPSMMLGGFVLVNIPVLDSHLHDKYGMAFDEYAARTRKLIPFVY